MDRLRQTLTANRRWLAILLLTVAEAVAAQTPRLEISIESDVGDYVGDGGTYHLVSAASTDFDQPVPDAGLADIRWTNGGFWQFRFGGPNSARLQVGAYENAL